MCLSDIIKVIDIELYRVHLWAGHSYKNDHSWRKQDTSKIANTSIHLRLYMCFK